MRHGFFAMVAMVAGLAVGAASGKAQTPADSTFWIHLERGDSLEASTVDMSWGDYVRYRRLDGSLGYVSANRVARILDGAGTDRRDYVMKEHGRLGAPLPASSERGYRSLAFRGADGSMCSSFLVTESGVLIALKRDAARSDQKYFGFIDLGWMKNVGSRSALGASGFWLSGSDHNRGGVRARYRRWLGVRTSLELSPGIVLDGNDTYQAPGFIGQVGVNAGDLASVVAECEVSRYRETVYTGTGPTLVPAEAHRTETTFRMGIRGGSSIGLAAMVLTGLFFASWGGPGL